MNKETLTIKEDFVLNENHEIVTSVINEQITYEKLIVEDTKNAFEENFLKSQIYKRFWTNLGKSVAVLGLYVRAPVDLELYFVNLRELYIEKPAISRFISPLLFQTNVGLEVITINESIIDTVSNAESPEINEIFFDILNYCKSLKYLDFRCQIPVEANIINELFAELNFNCMGMDEVIFDCDPLPFWLDYQNYYWITDEIEMEFIRNETARKVIIKPFCVREKLMEGYSGCAENCSLNHQVFGCETVKILEFEYGRKCNKYYNVCFESFPHVYWLDQLCIDDAAVLNLMSEKLTHLNKLSLKYDGPIINTWPSFPKMGIISIVFPVLSPESFDSFAKSCPNLKHLKIEVRDGITDDDFIKIVVKYLTKIGWLQFKCGTSQLTATGLDLIANNLKDLQKLFIYSAESVSDIEKLFVKLPKLETVTTNHEEKIFTREQFHHKTSREKTKNFIAAEDPSEIYKEMQINDLPTEILEQVFLYLNQMEQRRCRQVSKLWFNIFSSSPTLDRSVDLENSYLSLKTNPVKLLVHTNFKYNRLIFLNTNFPKNEDLTMFWEKLGTEIEDIWIVDSNFMDAFATGLKNVHLLKLTKIFFNYELLKQNIAEWKLLLNRIETLHVYSLKLWEHDGEQSRNTEVSLPNVTELKIIENFQSTKMMFELCNTISYPKIKNFEMLSRTINITDMQQLFQTHINFNQLHSLSIGKHDKWEDNHFELILRCCSNLMNLTIGVGKDFVENLNCKKVAREMFDNLLFLCQMRFLVFETEKHSSTKRYKKYFRTGLNEIDEKTFCIK